jgi:methylglutaconyl-CoA hydratase
VVTIRGAVASVALNRPEVRNAFNAQMIAEVTDAFSTIAAHQDVRVVVLRGNGPSFSAGADVSWMRAGLDLSREENLADAARLSDMFETINAAPIPVVGKVHGAALGAGMGLMAVCDIVVAARDAVFGFTEVKLGIIPAVISPYAIAKIGEGWARALFVTGERFDAELARQIGLAHWIADADGLDAAVDEKIDEILSAGPRAVREAKLLVQGVLTRPRHERRAYTAERIASVRTSSEGQAGLRAFLDKRPAPWRER